MKQLQHKVQRFENNKWLAWQLVIFVTCIFIVLEFKEIYEPELYQDYFDHVQPFLETCEPFDVPNERGAFKWQYICASAKWFGNERLLPFIFSIALIPLTFVLIKELTKKKLAGLIAVLVLITSGLFTQFHPIHRLQTNHIF